MEMASCSNDGSKDSMADMGACRYGNFMNYYRFHTVRDRLLQLPRDVWRTIDSDQKYVGLDVGCNAGDLTFGLQNFLRSALSAEHRKTDVFLLGVDLDPRLIERARKQNLCPDRITFECLDFISERRNEVLQEHLAKWDRAYFDVAFCFSISMWIHLNHGDAGLVKFLRAVCEVSDMIVVEPQSWKCYKKASRRLRRSNVGDFPLLKTLVYKDNVEKHIENILSDCCDFRKVLVTTSNNWGRKLLIYERNKSVRL